MNPKAVYHCLFYKTRPIKYIWLLLGIMLHLNPVLTQVTSLQIIDQAI